MPNSSPSKGIVWIPILLTFLIIFFAAFFPIITDDIFMYLALGRKLLEGRLPITDPFAYPFNSHPWHILHEWGSYLFYYSVYKLGGFTGIIAAKSLLITLTFFIASFPLVRNKSIFLPPFCLLASYAGCLRFYEKASLFSDLFTVALISFTFILPSLTWLWYFLIPSLFLIWSNLHPGFIIGLVVLFIRTLDSLVRKDFISSKRYGISFILSFVTCLINPLNLRGFWYPIQKLLDPNWNVFRDHLFEWMPTFMNGAFSIAEVQALSVIWGLTGFALALNRKNKPYYEWALFILLIFLGQNAVRFMFLTSAGALAILCQQWAQLGAAGIFNKPFKNWKTASSLLAILLICELTYGYPTYVGQIKVGTGLSKNTVPINATEFIDKNQIQGNIFNENDWGSYLAWHWNGERKVFYHGHIDDPTFLQKHYMSIFRSQDEFDKAVQEFDIQVFLLRRRGITTQHPESSKPLISGLKNGSWKLVYYDDLSVVVVRSKVANSEL